MKKQYFALVIIILASCTSIPKGVKPVSNFDIEKYLGMWYELARLDHSFERGLSNVSATYTLRKDGGIDVVNKGFNVEERLWDEAQGKAYFVSSEDVGHLKVSFFGPFYASYVIISLDDEYTHSLVTGPDRDFLWVLSRSPVVDSVKLDELIEKAKRLGYATDQLIYVDQKSIGPTS